MFVDFANLKDARLYNPVLPVRIRKFYDLFRGTNEVSYDRSLVAKTTFLSNALIHKDLALHLLDRDAKTLLGRMIRQRPYVWDFFTGPYICAQWDLPKRVGHFIEHVETLERLGHRFAFDIDESIELTHLQPVGSTYHVVIDKPAWFHREGVLTINLFRSNLRLFSLSFALSTRPQGLVALVGGIQGRKLEGILDEYHKLTKLGHGMRPRDLLIELFRMYCCSNGIMEIQGISENSRYQRSSHFGKKEVELQFHSNYDEIWLDRGSEPIDRCFFRLPIGRQSRDLSDIPSKKRSMYRKRYDLLDRLKVLVVAGVHQACPVRRPQAA